MIDWIQHWDQMRFYYWSGLNWLILLPVYIVGAGLITLLWWRLAKRFKRVWIAILPLYAVLAVAPWLEELSIASNFGQLCKKDAGIFIYKTVEVEGFFDTTRTTHDGPRTPQGAEELDRSGYRFYEMVLPNRKGGPDKVVHLEKSKGEWMARVLDDPTARYHYGKDSGTQVAHKIQKQTSIVLDRKSQEILGRYVRYSREAPWFFISLGDPGLGCDGPDGGPKTKHSFLIYREILNPTAGTGETRK